jgi:oligopeptidase B
MARTSSAPGSSASRKHQSLEQATPPIAPKREKVLEMHGDRRIDSYYWLRDRDNPEVIEYLKAENAYTEAQMKHTEALQQQLYDEMLGRIQETDLSVPYRYGAYFYYSRTEEGKAYGIYCRKQGSLEAPEEILIDANQLAEGHEFFDLGDYEVSLNHQILAYSTDTNGSEKYTLVLKDLLTGEHFPEQIHDVGGVAWANDNATLFYTRLDEANRPYQLWRHRIGTDPANDTLIHEEPDEAYYLGISISRSNAYLFLSAESKITSEVRFLDANQPDGEFQMVQPRDYGIEYSVVHHPGDRTTPDTNRFYIVTNENATNFKLMVTPVATPGKEHWTEVIPHRDDVMLDGVSAFANHLVIFEREKGLPTIRVQNLSTSTTKGTEFPEPAYAV